MSTEVHRRSVIRDMVEGVLREEGEEGVVMEWVVAISVQGITEDGEVYTSYHRIAPHDGIPPHHIDGLLEKVVGLDEVEVE